LVASFGIIHRPGYYTSQPSAYYQADAEAGGVWLRGNDRLGVAQGSAVDPVVFDRLCEGCDADGNKLVTESFSKRRVLGVDITLSSPKSVSVLYAIGGATLRSDIAAAERAAVEATLRLIEQEIPLARRGHNGVRQEHAQFTAAVFSHSEARPEVHADGSLLASVQRHHHVCLPSICYLPSTEDGSKEFFGAVDSVIVRSWKKALGARFRQCLATELEHRGFAIERDGDWRWGIARVPDEICKFFSARRTAIEAELAAAGVSSGEAPALAAAITQETRKQKETDPNVDRFARWRAAVQQLGYEPDTIVRDALQAGREAMAERDPAKLDLLIQDRIAILPNSLTEYEATFERRDLIEAVSNALVGTSASPERADQEAKDLIDRKEIIPLGVSRNGAAYSTPEMIEIEARLVETAAELANAHVTAPNADLLHRRCIDAGLSEEQAQVALAAASGARLVSISGPAGTGKTKSIEVVARSWEALGYRVIGSSVGWLAALALSKSDGVNIPSRAIDSWLKQSEDLGKSVFGPRVVCIIDESSLTSSIQCARVLDAVKRSGPDSVLVMVGDAAQLRPIGPGHAIRLIRATIGAVELRQVHRQREIWAREAPQAFARGDAEAALEAYSSRGFVELHDGIRPAVEALADAWQAARREAPTKTILVTTKTNAEARAVSGILRDRLRQEGIVRGPDVALSAVDASGNPNTLNIARGDTIVSLCRVDRIGVVNGTPMVVERIVGAIPGESVKITARRGPNTVTFRTDEFADSKGRIRLGNGLVSTLFRSQGITVDQSLVLLSGRFDRHDAYVAASRARDDTRFFCDRKSIDAAIRADSGDFRAAIDDAQRIDELARKLSRERIKTTTLDLIDIAKYAERNAPHERDRKKELSYEL
jgi:conjugative relaxase-like TrwC/TraI family protein